MKVGPVSAFFNTMDDSRDEEMIIEYYYYHNKINRRLIRFWVHLYIERNFHYRLYVVVREFTFQMLNFYAFVACP